MKTVTWGRRVNSEVFLIAKATKSRTNPAVDSLRLPDASVNLASISKSEVATITDHTATHSKTQGCPNDQEEPTVLDSSRVRETRNTHTVQAP